MEFTHIPNLKAQVSQAGLGTWAIGGWLWGGTEEKDAIATILKAFDKGINLIDTAPVYGFGKAETIVGKELKQYGNLDSIVIATKCGLAWENASVYRDSRKEAILNEVEASLKRLAVDYIDLYQVHWPDSAAAFSDTAEVLDLLYN